MNIDLLNETYIDIFKEIANIGSSHATSSLATMLKDVLKMDVPNVRIVKPAEIASLLGNEEQIVSATLLTMDGDITGIMMNIFDEASSLKIINEIVKTDVKSLTSLSEIEVSFLNELGNILTSSYLSALSTLTHLNIIPSTPNLCVDMAGAVLSVPAIQYGIISDEMLLIETQFSNETSQLKGYYLMVPDEPSFAKILTSLGVKLS